MMLRPHDSPTRGLVDAHQNETTEEGREKMLPLKRLKRRADDLGFLIHRGRNGGYLLIDPRINAPVPFTAETSLEGIEKTLNDMERGREYVPTLMTALTLDRELLRLKEKRAETVAKQPQNAARLVVLDELIADVKSEIEKFVKA